MLWMKENINYELDDIEDTIFFSPASADDEIEEQIAFVTEQSVADAVKEWQTRAWGPRKERSHLKIFWDHGYNNCSETECREHIRVDKGTSELILYKINTNIYKTPTNTVIMVI